MLLISLLSKSLWNVIDVLYWRLEIGIGASVEAGELGNLCPPLQSFYNEYSASVPASFRTIKLEIKIIIKGNKTVKPYIAELCVS